MSQAVIVARVAVRDLWMSFRLLLVLVAFVGGSAVVALVPAPPAVVLDRLGLGLALATVISSGVAAWTIAAERREGRAGWFISRSVSRGTYLGGWFAGLLLIAAGGVFGSGLFGWLATLSLPIRIDPVAFAIVIAAVAATAAAGVSLGLAAGSILPPAVAAAVATAACAAIGATVLLAGWASPFPGGAFLLVGGLTSGSAVLPDALQATGVVLLLAAGLLVVARAGMARAEL